MTLTVLFCAIFFAILFIHPYVIYPLTLKLLPERRIALGSTSNEPATATLVFCAFNEGANIEAKIANLELIKAHIPSIKFKAFVDCATDNTLALLDPHKELIEIHVASKRSGKALGMRQLVDASDTDLMIFTDANVTLDPASVSRILAYFEDSSVGGVCGTLQYVNPFASSTTEVNANYWSLEEKIKNLESKSGSTMGADGSIFATRRALYPTVPPHLLDDFIVSMTVVFSGYRLISATDVLAFERLATRSEDEFARKRRIACRAYSSHRHMASSLRKLGALNRYKYFSHRFVRWYGAFELLLCGALFYLWIYLALGAAWFLIAVLLLGAVALAASRSAWPAWSRLGEAMRAVVATALGVIDAWRGKQRQFWDPAKSR